MIEDDEDFALGLSLMLRSHRFDSVVASTLKEALAVLSEKSFDAIVSDLSLPDASGIDVVSAVHQQQPHYPILVLTGQNDAQLAVQALRLGARDYLTKPIRKQELLQALEMACAQTEAQRSSLFAQRKSLKKLAIGESRAWKEALSMIQAAASAPKTTVLLTGEPGVGKEVAAYLIHQWSARAEQVMIAVNVAGLPGPLLESELFGHEAGAFTGAQGLKKGLFEQAEKGTLFLDEIGELPLEL
ncbi:MAG: sigma-54-dependent Fis family transcriptional regulator [Myxococcales bacterium]|nr:sigma-54-dependent Fis family transcriptional regulator [Myxococcales bacterium]